MGTCCWSPGRHAGLQQGISIGLPETSGQLFNLAFKEGKTIMSSSITETTFVQITEHRPWGNFTVLADEKDHKVKRITVNSGARLSLQRHKRRQEHWLVVSGTAHVTIDKDIMEIGPGEAVDIPKETIHRVENRGKVPLVFIEIQLGDYFGEDDIERLEDDYGRLNK